MTIPELVIEEEGNASKLKVEKIESSKIMC